MKTKKKKLLTRLLIALFIGTFTITTVPSASISVEAKSSTSHRKKSRKKKSSSSTPKKAASLVDVKNPYSTQLISYDNFNADAYAVDNPDVAQALGLDKGALYQHFINYGYYENRVVHSYDATEDLNLQLMRRMRLSSSDPNYVVPFSSFNYAQYAIDYPDVATVYGNDPSALYNHYIYCGINEGRFAHSIYSSEDEDLIAVNIAKQVVASITNPAMSTRDKIQTCHDWIVNNTSYDYGNYLAGTIPTESYYIYGVFVNHVAVCNGYTLAFKLMMDILGIPCEKIDGMATNSVGNTGLHAWNKVNVDGTWLYVDVTWDDPVCDDGTQMLRYDYFLIDEATMNRDHFPD